MRGDSIPIEAAIVGLADAIDAMTTDRPYSSARSLDDATEEVVRNRGTQFAPAVVDAFLDLVERTPELFAPDPADGELGPGLFRRGARLCSWPTRPCSRCTGAR